MYDVAACPQGYNAEFCCLANGELTFAAISPSGQATCPQLGATQQWSSDPAVCSSSPSFKCCYGGSCYPSKDIACMRYTNFAGVPYGTRTDDCNTCSVSNTMSQNKWHM